MKVGRVERALEYQEQALERLDLEVTSIGEQRARERQAFQVAITNVALGGAAPVKESPRLAEAIDAFIGERTTRSRWTAKTLEKKQLGFRLFQQFMGERLGHEPRMNEIDRASCVAFLGLLQKLPINIKRNHPGRSLSEIAALGLPPISAMTINGITSPLSGFFHWCKETPAFKIDHNPAYQLSIAKKLTKQLREFSDQELAALFSSPAFTYRMFLHPYRYWLIPLALHTGARLGELCQLTLSDFIAVDGITCIRINEEDEGKHLKNKNSSRLVPVHSFLIEIGLMRYVETLHERGETRLFPELDLRISSSQVASKWFNDKRGYSNSCGVIDPNTNFHSFRRTFITRAIKKTSGGGGADPHDVAAIVGHEHGLITMDTYFDGKADAAERLATVQRFQLPDEIRVLIPPMEDMTFGKLAPRQRWVG
jgi:integrase